MNPVTSPVAARSGALDLSELQDGVEEALRDFFEEKAGSLRGGPLPGVVDDLRDFVAAGGKRIRPVLCLCGWHAAGARGDDRGVTRVAASLELFHAFALIHDDVIDDSATRRGRPALHRMLARRGPGGIPQAASDHLGASSAILVGDLALMWSVEMAGSAGLTAGQADAVTPLLESMRTEVTLGQYLDVLASGRPTDDVEAALRITRYKTAKYTVERPLHIGAALAGADGDVLAACSDYALAMGEAFQLRDDLLGVFGDPATTGKPVLDDLREGKATALIALAMARATPEQSRTLRRLVGDPALGERDAATVRGILTVTGARRIVEEMIDDRRRRALDVLGSAPFRPAAGTALKQLADSVAARSS